MKNMMVTSVPLTPVRDTPLALQSQGAQSAATASRPSFEEASIRQCDPDTCPLRQSVRVAAVRTAC
jgi:hypothetical protein